MECSGGDGCGCLLDGRNRSDVLVSYVGGWRGGGVGGGRVVRTVPMFQISMVSCKLCGVLSYGLAVLL